MRPLDLTLNGLPADLPAQVRGLLKLQQARTSLADVAARVGEYSFPLTLPPTQGNARIFGAAKLHPQGLGKFGPATDYAYRLAVGGEVFSGTFRLTAASPRTGYTGSLIGSGFSWALALGEKKLPELGLAPLAYDGSQLAAILAKGCDTTDVQFPLVAFGNFYAPPLSRPTADGGSEQVPNPPAAVLDYPLSVDDYPPGVYFVNVLRRIFQDIGWQLVGRELDAPFWRQVVLTCAGADVAAAWPWGALLPASGTAPQGSRVASFYDAGPAPGYTNDAVGFYTLPGDGPELSGDVVFLPVRFTSTPARPTRSLDLSTATYTALREGVYDFTWACKLDSYTATYGGQNVGQHDPFVEALLRPVGLGLVVRRGGQGFDEGEGGLLRGDPNAGALDYRPGQDRVLTPQRLDTGLGTLSTGARTGTVGSVYLQTGDTVTLAVFARRTVFSGTNDLLGYCSQLVLNYASAALACTRYADNDGVSVTELRPALFLPPLRQVDVVRDFLVRCDALLLADASRRVATLLTRDELGAAQGPALDLGGRYDPDAVSYAPAAGADVGSVVFSPAGVSPDAAGTDANPLVPALADVVTAPIGPGAGSQQVGSLFAVVGYRTLYGTTGAYGPVATCASKDVLKQNRSETEPDIKGEAPRLVRYLGPDPVRVVPFTTGTVPLALTAWDGPLAWDGAAGAVARYWQPTLRRLLSGHLAKLSLPLHPAEYRALLPGRRVTLGGAPYTVEAVAGWDAADEASLADLTLSREVA